MFRGDGRQKITEYEIPRDAQGRLAIIDIRDVTKIYQMGNIEVRALQGITLQIFEGEFVAIMGPSGSGKSTLMNILGALDQPTSGKYYLAGKDVSQADDRQLAAIRNEMIGFVFQNFNLLKRTSALRQVELPLIYASKPGNRRERARAALEAVGLGARLHHLPSELSGGQQQRVAIARALVTEPKIILADEPTGNLDTKSGIEVLRIFQQLNRERGMTTVFVTHDPFVARHTERVIMLRDGRIIADRAVSQPLIAGEAERPSEMAELEDIFRETYDAPAEEFT
ncbi:MAG: ABC transporter ATP-binding protein [Anaerolineae bacterium]|nr:ABC transporter ATP-binding protein [Anaerolineae bacterium]